LWCELDWWEDELDDACEEWLVEAEVREVDVELELWEDP